MALGWGTLAAAGALGRELLFDPEFAAGLRPSSSYCVRWSRNQALQLGDCLEYAGPASIDVSAQKLTLASVDAIPPRTGGDRGKFWEVTTGEHWGKVCLPPAPFTRCIPQAFPLADGSRLEAGARLHKNQLTLNHRLVEDSSQRLFIVGDGPSAPNLVFDSNRLGKVRMTLDTGQDFLNLATSYGPEFRFNPWPHFLLVQRWKDLIDLASFQRVVIRAEVQIDAVRELPGNRKSPWEARGSQNAALSAYVFLREKDGFRSKNGKRVSSPESGVWLGIRLFQQWAHHPVGDTDNFSVDQWGLTMLDQAYAAQFGTPVPPGTGTHAVRFEVRQALQKAEAMDREGNMLPSPDDYSLALFNIGWEVVGQYAVKYQLDHLSVDGAPKASLGTGSVNALNHPETPFHD